MGQVQNAAWALNLLNQLTVRTRTKEARARQSLNRLMRQMKRIRNLARAGNCPGFFYGAATDPKSTFAELFAAACTVQTHFFAFNFTCITRDKTGLAKLRL